MSDPYIPQIYLISPEKIRPEEFSPTLDACLACAPVAAFQLRLPGASPEVIRKTVGHLMPVCRSYDVAFLLADDANLAGELHCDGVHLEQDISPEKIKASRQALGTQAFIGASAINSRHNAMLAAEQGADYISFGPVFKRPTKNLTPDTRPDLTPDTQLDTLSWWARFMEIPCVAAGGITARNCRQIRKTNAEYIALLSAVWHHQEGPVAALGEFLASLNSP